MGWVTHVIIPFDYRWLIPLIESQEIAHSIHVLLSMGGLLTY
jgi:hypothetical protein